MNLIKQYIIQSISAASNNLRLNTQKIEVVALLREAISKSPDLEADIKEMKKVTELSKFAIRLNEIYTFLTQPQVDFFRISEKFKEHSQYLIKDLSCMLDTANPVSFKAALEKVRPSPAVSAEIPQQYPASVIDVDLSKRSSDSAVFEKSENDIAKEKIILEEDKDEDENFHSYETQVLSQVKPLENFLQKLSPDNIDKSALGEFKSAVKKNAEFSTKAGFEIIAGMHEIISEGLDLIENEKLIPDKYAVESIRACLIVIVAVIKGKEIDISGYLNRAEQFASELKKIK